MKNNKLNRKSSWQHIELAQPIQIQFDRRNKCERCGKLYDPNIEKHHKYCQKCWEKNKDEIR